MACPNLSSQSWKDLVSKIGVFEAFKEFVKNGEQIPDVANYSETLKGVNASLKIINALNNPKIEGFFKNQYLKGNQEKFFQEVTALAGKQQTELLRDHLKNNSYTSLPEMIVGLLSEMSYTVEINTAKKDIIDYNDPESYDDLYGTLPEEREQLIKDKGTTNTQHYSNMTVPGGTNYTENEIATPAIIPSIKGHAQFATDNGIGWFRSDDKTGGLQYIYTKEELEDFLPERFNVGEEQIRYVPSENKWYSDTTRSFLTDEQVTSKYLQTLPQKEATKTRRILEVQSDIFQKSRDIKSAEDIYAEMKKSGDLIIDCG
jgi:hypothetical protein